MLVRLCGVILSLIVLYCIGIKMYITFPPADFIAVMSLWRLLSLSCVVFIFIPSFYHISSSSPNALLISVHFNPSHSDCIRFIPLWVEWWSEVETHGSFMDIDGSSLLMAYRAAVFYGIWNTHTVDSPSTLIFFPWLNECTCCDFSTSHQLITFILF